MKYNVYALNGKLIDANLTSAEVEEKYEINMPDRTARRGLITHGMYKLTQVE